MLRCEPRSVGARITKENCSTLAPLDYAFLLDIMSSSTMKTKYDWILLSLLVLLTCIYLTQGNISHSQNYYIFLYWFRNNIEIEINLSSGACVDFGHSCLGGEIINLLLAVDEILSRNILNDFYWTLFSPRKEKINRKVS